MPKRRAVDHRMIHVASDENGVCQLRDLDAQQRLGSALVVVDSVKGEEGMDNAGNAGGLENVRESGVGCEGMDE